MCMKEDKKEVIEESQNESTKNVTSSTSSVEDTTKKDTKDIVSKEDTIKETKEHLKELEELRKFKKEVIAKQKEEAQKAKEVKVSDTFLSKNEPGVTNMPNKSNIEKKWEELFEEGIPKRYEE